MLKFKHVAAVLTLGVAGAAIAGGHGGDPTVKARKAHMTLYSFNLGLLGDMAKGKTSYDATIAATAANDLAALAAFDESNYWAEGTAQGEVEGSRAKAEIWTDAAGWAEKRQLMATGAASLAAVAGDGLESLQSGIAAAGEACGTCHKAYRGPRN